jgi:hypothetical protein
VGVSLAHALPEGEAVDHSRTCSLVAADGSSVLAPVQVAASWKYIHEYIDGGAFASRMRGYAVCGCWTRVTLAERLDGQSIPVLSIPSGARLERLSSFTLHYVEAPVDWSAVGAWRWLCAVL